MIYNTFPHIFSNLSYKRANLVVMYARRISRQTQSSLGRSGCFCSFCTLVIPSFFLLEAWTYYPVWQNTCTYVEGGYGVHPLYASTRNRENGRMFVIYDILCITQFHAGNACMVDAVQKSQTTAHSTWRRVSQQTFDPYQYQPTSSHARGWIALNIRQSYPMEIYTN